MTTAVTGRVQDKVVFITGAARGQGRSHAVRLADEGADILAVDLCGPVRGVQYPASTRDDLAETVALVEKTGRRIVAEQVDTRDAAALKTFVDAGVGQLGRLDVIVANAGICIAEPWHKVTEQSWQDTLDVNLTGSWNAIRAGVDHLVAQKSGSIIVTSSTAGLKGNPYLLSYVVSKHGVTGMVRALAHELGTHNVRVNAVNPATVATEMVGPSFKAVLEEAIEENPGPAGIFTKSLPITAAEPVDISNAVLFLASDESRFVTALSLSVDAGNSQY
ncbi:MAG: 3-ketoacyl-ACP reductase [Pseudonocardia sp. SCN 72-86]|nr:MAG: 3-ketoacyl-ACP reductase [Pseudonocardia sp. SCN 72-86]